MVDAIMKNDFKEKLLALPLSQFIDPREFQTLADYYQFVYRQTNDPVFFVDNVLTPINVQGEPIKLADYQKEAMYIMQRQQYSAMAWSRQIGKTETVSMLLPWLLFAQQQPWIVIAAPSNSQAKDLLHRQEQRIMGSKYLYDPSRVDLLDSLIKVEIQILNSLTGEMVTKQLKIDKVAAGDKANLVRGKSASVLVIEESQFISDDIMAEVVLPMASSKGSKIVQISTPHGKNHFYDTMFNKSYYETRIYDYTYGLRAGILDPKIIEDAKRNPQKFKQEYECSFNVNAISYIPSFLLEDAQKDYALGTEEQLMGIGKNQKFFMGVDWGGSGEDKTVQTVIAQWFDDKDLRYKVVDQIWFTTAQFGEKMSQIQDLYHKYECVYAYFDSYIGESQEDVLAKNYKIRADLITFSQQRKYNLYNNYKIQLEDKLLEMPKDNLLEGPFFVAETENLEEKKSASSPFSSIQPQGKRDHDDFPDSLALAITCANEKFGARIQQSQISRILDRVKHEDRNKYKYKEGNIYYVPNYNIKDLMDDDIYDLSSFMDDSLDIDNFDSFF